MPVRFYPEHRLVHVHVPKTAGTTLRRILAGDEPRAREQTFDFWTSSADALPWERSFVVRRPAVDRFLSAWAEWAPDWRARELVAWLRDPRIGTWSDGSPAARMRRHFVPEPDRVFAFRARHVLRWHRLEADYRELAARFGLPAPDPFPHLRQHKTRIEWAGLSADDRRLVEEFAVAEGELVYHPLG